MKMKKGVSVIIALLLGTAGFAEPAENNSPEQKLSFTYDITYMSKYMTKGFEGYGQKGGLFNSIDVNLYGTGFGINVTHRNAIGSGYADKQRFDYTLYYRTQLFKGTPFAMDIDISDTFKDYYKLALNESKTLFEWIFAFSWPNIMPGGLFPYYIAHYEYPAVAISNPEYIHLSGWVHRFGLGYDLKVNELPNPLRLTSEIAYTDGIEGASHDWSYATFGMTTKFNITKNLIFTPGVYEQITLDKSACLGARRDITYCSLSMKYKF
jgi:hypothetical protein